jgi:hypothetical protein
MPATEFKNRNVGLIVFGLLEIIVGLVYLLPLGALMATEAADAVPDATMAITLLASLAVISIWLGVGTLMARRWARALSLIIAWGWLGAGLLVLVYSLFAPHISGGVLGMFVFLTLFAGMFVLFYSGKNVRATFEARDRQLRWTDKCPLPVLVLTLGYGVLAVSALVGIYTNTAVPFFGTVFKDVTAQVYYTLQVAVFAYLAWGSYRLTPRAWLASVIITVLLSVSAVVSYSVIDMTTLYRAMNIPFDQIALMREQGWGTERIALISAVLGVASVAYLIYVKKFFTGAPLQERAV